MSTRRSAASSRNAIVPAMIAALIASSCEADTNLLIVIDGDLAVPSELDTLELSVAAGTAGFDHVFALDGASALPQSLVLQPGSYEGAEVEIVVVGRLGGAEGREVARGSATAAFSPGEQVRVGVTLTPTCRAVRCPDWQWCAADECVPRPCRSSVECDDGSPCNGDETCDGGTCAQSAPPVCDDGVGCTFDLCSDELGGCTTIPDHQRCGRSTELCSAEGCGQRSCSGPADCDDRVSCNGFETCSGSRCIAGEPPDCDDGIACTIDLCDERNGGCLSQPDHDLCGAGELCLPALGGCTSRPCSGDASECSDGVACNGEERCVEGACVPAAPVDDPCDDGDDCSTDFCQPSGCLHWLVDADGDGHPPDRVRRPRLRRHVARDRPLGQGSLRRRRQRLRRRARRGLRMRARRGRVLRDRLRDHGDGHVPDGLRAGRVRAPRRGVQRRRRRLRRPGRRGHLRRPARGRAAGDRCGGGARLILSTVR